MTMTYTAARIIGLRATIQAMRGGCACNEQPYVCESCRRAIRLCAELRELMLTSDGKALLVQELTEYQAKIASTPPNPAYAGMNDFIPF